MKIFIEAHTTQSIDYFKKYPLFAYVPNQDLKLSMVFEQTTPRL